MSRSSSNVTHTDIGGKASSGSPSNVTTDFTRLTALAATGLMRRLSYPHDFAELDRVRDAVLADVGASGRS